MKFEAKFDYETLINEAIKNVEVKYLPDEDQVEDLL